ncbi:hypothetical protein C1H46_016385 [Malus baccata]|uniref:Uncharacterized protein n=1 Tax=Malus baccata TaxID=106549 RepID=A0A540MH41_MALBA|nr:hypothetical protein C1H46_016385 [Malus baccata]
MFGAPLQLGHQQVSSSLLEDQWCPTPTLRRPPRLPTTVTLALICFSTLDHQIDTATKPSVPPMVILKPSTLASWLHRNHLNTSARKLTPTPSKACMPSSRFSTAFYLRRRIWNTV